MEKIKTKKRLATFNLLTIALYALVVVLLFTVELASFSAYNQSNPDNNGWNALGLVVVIIYGSIFLGVSAIFNLIGGVGLFARKHKNAVGFVIVGFIGKLAGVLALGWIIFILIDLYPGWITAILYILITAAVLAGAVYDMINVKRCK